SQTTPAPDWPEETRRAYEDLRTYRIVGASACVVAIMGALQAVAQQTPPGGKGAVLRRVSQTGEHFCALKPNTAAYVNAVRWLLIGIEDGADDRTAAAVISGRVQEYAAYHRESMGRIAARARELLPAGSHVLVHDYSSSVLAAVTDASRQGRILTVFVTAGEPLGQGPKLARAIAASGHRIVYLPDAGIGRVMGEIDIVLSGVETLFRGGDLANTVGTYPIALAARDANIPVYGVTERIKIHPTAVTATACELHAQVLHPWPPSRVALPAGADIRNQVLDLTPARLITGYVTEEGVLPPAGVGEALDRLFEDLAQIAS
ncbi:MAG: hypothetical protein ACRDFX_05840, partial [Chloroflexota bacterium]